MKTWKQQYYEKKRECERWAKIAKVSPDAVRNTQHEADLRLRQVEELLRELEAARVHEKALGEKCAKLRQEVADLTKIVHDQAETIADDQRIIAKYDAQLKYHERPASAIVADLERRFAAMQRSAQTDAYLRQGDGTK